MFSAMFFQKKPAKASGMSRVELEQIIYSAIRHQPKYYGLILDEGGWVGVDTLVYRINFLHNKELLTKSSLVRLADKNPKFTLNFFKTQIRANEIDDESLVTIRKAVPPETLYVVVNKNCTRLGDDVIPCGDADRVKMCAEIPEDVERNRILRVDSNRMFSEGYSFYHSDRDDWFTRRIPVRYVSRVN